MSIRTHILVVSVLATPVAACGKKAEPTPAPVTAPADKPAEADVVAAPADTAPVAAVDAAPAAADAAPAPADAAPAAADAAPAAADAVAAADAAAPAGDTVAAVAADAIPALFADFFKAETTHSYDWEWSMAVGDQVAQIKTTVQCKVGALEVFGKATVASFECTDDNAKDNALAQGVWPGALWVATSAGLFTADMKDAAEVAKVIAEAPSLAAEPKEGEEKTAAEGETPETTVKIYKDGTATCHETTEATEVPSKTTFCFEAGKGIVKIAFEGRDGKAGAKETYTLKTAAK